MRLLGSSNHAALELLGDDDAIVAEGLSKAYHDIAERVFEPPTPLLTRAFKGRRPRGLQEETVQDDDGFDDTDLDDDDGDDENLVDELEEASAVVWGLRNASFRIPNGAAVALVGDSSSGKTTLLRILAGALPPSSGMAVLASRPSPLVSMATELMVPTISPARNVAIAGSLVGMRKRSVAPYIARIVTLAEVPLDDQRVGVTRSPYKLAVASAIELGSILLLDEPLAAPSRAFRRRVIEAIAQRNAEGATVMLATSDREALRRLCDSAIWLNEGSVAQIGPLEEILTAYDASAAASRASEPHPSPGAGFNETAAIVSGQAQGDPDGHVTVALRLETSRASVTMQNGVGIVRDDGFGLWLEQPNPVVCQLPGFQHFQVVVHGVPPGHYRGLIQTRVLEAGMESVLARNDAFELTVGAADGRTRHGVTRWEPREASWLYASDRSI